MIIILKHLAEIGRMFKDFFLFVKRILKFFANLISRGLYSFFQVKGKEVRIMLIEDFSDEMIEFG